MRKFFKYYLDFNSEGISHLGIDSNIQEYSKSMGNYVIDESYKSKSAFLKKYFFECGDGRFKYYDNFLRQHLSKDDDILSIASGRCVNEIRLIDEGYKITCSDVELFEVYQETKKWLSDFNCIKFDILNGASPKQFDKIICLSLIYLFDKEQLSLCFKHIFESLKNGGFFILDSAGTPDSLWSFLFNDIYVKYEILSFRLLKLILSGKSSAFVVKHNGYRRTDREIIECAKKHNLVLEYKNNYDFLTEFKRSIILQRFLKPGSYSEHFFSILGRQIPYIRMFVFKKVSNKSI